jgi:hypothetical protein
LRIDPLIQQGSKLTGAGETGAGDFAESVALSSDGNTAVVGAPNDANGVGAAFVFTRSGATWAQQGPKLTADDETGAGRFGTSVAISGDGNTVLIGGPADNAGAATNDGAAWVFTRSGTTWAQDGSKLTAPAGSVQTSFGAGVGLSGDGNTAAIGAPKYDAGRGAVYMFMRSGSGWTQEGGLLTANDEQGAGAFGSGVAVSDHASTVVIGAPMDAIPAEDSGSAWVFTASGSTWIQAAHLAIGGYGDSEFGTSVAISSDGNTVVGGAVIAPGEPAAVAFARSGSTWTQQGDPLTADDGGAIYTDVALSGDGNTALVGGPGVNDDAGSAATFQRTGSSWGPAESLLPPTDETGAGEFGSSVAMSGDGSTALVGGPLDDPDTAMPPDGVGAAWAFVTPPPTTCSAPPTINTQPPNVTVTAPGTATFTAAASAPANCPVTVQWLSHPQGGVVFTPISGAKSSSYTTPPTAVAQSATSYEAVFSDPAGSAVSNVGVLTVLPPPPNQPIVTAVYPSSGYWFSLVLIGGEKFTGVTAVDFGNTPTLELPLTSTLILALAPPGLGTVDVTVHTAKGTSATSSADRFSYTNFFGL